MSVHPHLQAPALYAQAVHEFQCYHGDPIATIRRALALDPDYARGHLFHGWLHALSTEAGAAAVVAEDIAQASVILYGHTPRTHSPGQAGARTGRQSSADHLLLQALEEFQRGLWAQASRTLAQVNERWPHDALVLTVGHLVDFLRGDSMMLRNRIAHALPAWSDTDPGYHALLGMLAFGQEECGELPQAEASGRAALELEPTDAWAHHAVAHVMEMQGRTHDGARFMQERENQWAENGFFAIHNYWHWAMFLLDQGDIVGTLALFDGPLQGGRSPLAVDVVDAAALLWRLRLLGHDNTERWQQVAAPCAASVVPGYYSFNDFHAKLVQLGTCSTTGWAAPVSPQGDHVWLNAHVGQPLCAAFQDYAEGRYAAAVERLLEVRPRAQRFGGSHAQRDLIDVTLLDAAARAGHTTLARSLLRQRLAVKPHSFINQRLRERVDQVGSSPTHPSQTPAPQGNRAPALAD